MVLTHVRSDPGRAAQSRERSPTQGGVRVPSALAIDANGQSMPPS
jgi:hypothetical protein